MTYSEKDTWKEAVKHIIEMEIVNQFSPEKALAKKNQYFLGRTGKIFQIF
jgi:hypothetical protein